MKFIIADNYEQAKFCVKELQLGIMDQDIRYLHSITRILGVDRSATIYAVGQQMSSETYNLIAEIEKYGYTVKFLPKTL